MKSLFFLAAVLGAAAAAELVSIAYDPWFAYKQRFNKRYANVTEDRLRRSLWDFNRLRIAKHNSEAAQGIHSYTMEDNALSDLTAKEQSILLGTRAPAGLQSILPDTTNPNLNAVYLPSSFNYLSSSCLPAVKNQGSCGSCWAFGATTPIEFLTCNKTNVPTVLSESQLVNCSFDFNNDGCAGGWYPNAWNYVKVAPGLASAAALPYYPSDAGDCGYDSNMKVATLASYTRLANDANQIMQALIDRGPITVAIKVLSATFNSYKSGVYSDPACPKTCASSDVNHAVIIIGFGTDTTTNTPYWLVRNSWGSNWGDAGYIKIKRGVNMCNIECFAYYVTI